MFMVIKQVADLMNGVTQEIIGDTAVVNEDLSNVVDVGKAIFDNTSYDHFVKTLVDHIGRVMFVDRKYTGNTLSLYRDSWEYGAVMEKVYGLKLPEATENETWELEDGASYDPNIFTKPEVAAKFYDKRVTLDIPLSIADKQAKSAFSSANQLNAFVSMLWNDVDKSSEVKMEGLASRTVNSFIASTIANEFPSVSNNDYSNSTGVKAINLLKEYNTIFSGATTTKDACLYNPEFIRYATLRISKTLSRMTRLNTLFNIGGIARFTPSDKQHLVLLSDFASASKVYLQADTFHDDLVRLGKGYTEVPYWQGSGTAYALSSVGNVHAEVAYNGSTKEINISHVLGVAFDHDACGMTNLDKRVTSNYNGKAEFTNFWNKQDVGLFRDENEQFVVFFVA